MNRQEIARMLLGEQEEADRAYLTNEIDRDTWAKTLQSVDERLSVIGLRLAARPWDTSVTSRAMSQTGF
jgi:hypothetical protein